LPGAEPLAKCALPLFSCTLPGAQSPANQVIAYDHVRALAPGKFAWGRFPGITPNNFSDACRLP